jgi:hypothetical protein
LLRNLERAYLAASGEGKHQLDEEFRKSVPSSENKHQLDEEFRKSVPGSKKANIGLMRNSGRPYLAASEEGKHQLDEKFKKSIPRSTCCLPACRISGYTNVVSNA